MRSFIKRVQINSLHFGLIIFSLLLYSSCQNSSKSPKQETIEEDKITKVKHNIELSNFSKLNVAIPKESIQSLTNDRAIAIKHGLLSKRAQHYVPATINYNGEELKAKIRLKGTQQDHWGGNGFWSLKVKLANDNYINNSSRFGLMTIDKRGFLVEWLYHKMMKSYGNLWLNYNYVNLSINNKQIGIIAMEEAFSEQLAADTNELSGYVLKWNLKQYFDTLDIRAYYKRKAQHPKEHEHLPNEVYLNAPISVYGSHSNETVAFAIELLEDFRNKRKPTHEVFDVEKLATTFAINTLFGNQHPLYIHNVRLYFNFETNLFEIVPYDIERLNPLTPKDRYEVYLPWDTTSIFRPQQVAYIFEDTVFYNAYLKKQLEVIDSNSIIAFFENIEQEKKLIENQLKKVCKQCKFQEKEMLLYNAKYIRKELQDVL